MKKQQNKLQQIWQNLWESDEYDQSKKHLSKADKRSLLIGAFFICSATMLFTSIVWSWNISRIVDKQSEELQTLQNTVFSYVASATNEEFDELSQTFRHDLMTSKMGRDIETYLEYLPNTTETCCLDAQTLSSQIYLLCTNTGELYPLDLHDDEADVSVSFGYDEVSQLSLKITQYPNAEKASAVIDRCKKVVSIQRMKSLFCDDCIRNMIQTVEGELVSEVVLFDASTAEFYPVSTGTLEIGEYLLETSCKDDRYQLEVSYNEK